MTNAMNAAIDPIILGVYYSETTERVGSGGTTKDVRQRIFWFAVQLSQTKCVLEPLNDQGLPGGFKRVVTLEELLSRYTLDPEHYMASIHPVLVSLKRKIGPLEGYVNTSGFTDAEQRVFASLQIEGQLARHEREGWTRQRLVRHLLQTMPEHDHIRYTFASRLNTRSISLRKEGRLDAAIDSYLKALKSHPNDDHLHFNLARAYFEKGDMEGCREMLAKALAINPHLAEARRFQAFLRQNDG